MKNIRTKTFCLILGVLACASNLIAQDTNIDWKTASDDQVILQAIELTSPIPPSQIPTTGATFYSAQHSPISAQPWPPFPANVNNLSGWDIGSNVWVLDDIDFSYDAAAAQSSQSMMAMDAESPALPGTNDDGGTNTFSPDGVGFDPGTNLWLAQQSISGGNFTGILSNTVSGVSYQLLYANSLTPPIQWISDGFVTGTDGTNWTPWTLPFDPTTNFFLNALSWQTDGSGIPIWWQEEYFGTNIDPYADPIGDGYTLYQDYINGWIPTNWNTPPAPQGLTVDSFNNASDTATVSWLPSSGSVTGYMLETPNGCVNLPADVTSYIDDNSSLGGGYQIQADYAEGPSAWSDIAWVDGGQAPNADIVQGPQGNLYLITSQLPSDVTAIEIDRYSWDSGTYLFSVFPKSGDYVLQSFPNDPLSDGCFEIPAADITNGICEIPSSEVTPFFPYQFNIFAVHSNGLLSGINLIGQAQYGEQTLAAVPFIDQRRHMKDNLQFLLRAADDVGSFTFEDASFQGYVFSWPTNHVCADFYDEDNTVRSYPDPTEPLEDNLFYKNFVFDADNMTNVVGWAFMNTGYFYTGAYGSTGCLGFYNNDSGESQVEYFLNLTEFVTNPIVPVSVLSASETTYLAPPTYQGVANFYTNFPSSGDQNIYGLPFVAAEGAWYTNNTLHTQTFYPREGALNYWPYPDAEQPVFQITNYYFCEPGIDEMPETNDFASTNQSPLIIVPVGGQQQPQLGNTPNQLAAWARMSVGNANPGVYAYLGQFFTNAYQIDDNGNVTTNSAGLLSPYGQFFATEPGPVAIVTMPDIDTGQQGTDTIYCVSLNVDANHDGVMDTSFSGPDTTSENSPMEFWVNNGCDKPSAIGGYDANPMIPPATTNYTLGEITCPRDLENFARLWICGMPALPTNGNYQVTLSWENVQSGNPAVNLYWSCESDGGIGYLTNASVAALQISDLPGTPYGTSIGTVSNGASYTFPDNTFEFGGNQYLLFEGAGIGEGELTLTVSQNGNPVAQSGVWLDLHNIQDFYESAVITNIYNSVESTNWSSTTEIVQPDVVSSALGNDTNLIVFVHGFFVGDWDWQDDTETVFKRLYWAGFDGQFASVKWPCETESPLLFDLSELDAYKASTGMADYLNQLLGRFPGYRLNLLVHSQGNAVMSEAIEKGVPFATYILTQGAMPASCYDVNAPTNTTLFDDEASSPTPDWEPMGYHGVYTNLNQIGRVVNFYNTNDFFLTSGTIYGVPVNWIEDQSLKPDSPYGSDGSNVWEYVTGAPNMPITDPEVSRAFVARSRTDAVGAQAGLNGVISGSVDLAAQFGFGNTSDDHSAQWVWPIQTSLPYYQQVLVEIQPPQ